MHMIITLEPLGFFVQILYSYVFYHCPVNGMKNGDEASPSITLAS